MGLQKSPDIVDMKQIVLLLFNSLTGYDKTYFLLGHGKR